MESSESALNRIVSIEAVPGLVLRGLTWGDSRCPSVLLLHGGGETCQAWRGFAKRLVCAGYFVLAFDARGHGESDWARDGNYAVDAFGSDIGAIAAWIGRPTAVVGFSAGGLAAFYAIGANLVHNCPALVLIDIAIRPKLAGTDQIRRFLTSAPDGFASVDEACSAVAVYHRLKTLPKTESMARNLRQQANGRWQWHWDPRKLDVPLGDLRAQKLLDVSEGVTLPIVVLRGATSEVTDQANIAEMLTVLPQLEVQTVPECGHKFARDGHDGYADAIMAFLDRHWPARDLAYLRRHPFGPFGALERVRAGRSPHRRK